MFANIFALFISDHAPVRHLPGAAFVLAASLLFAAALIAVRVMRHSPAAAPLAIDEVVPTLPFNEFSSESIPHVPPEQSP